ncbi:MAG: CrcB family protein [Actinobacteria bacterium]|nr:CrcB family protein [Actinomycetota bacterium]
MDRVVPAVLAGGAAGAAGRWAIGEFGWSSAALTTFSTFVAELFEIHQIDRGWAWRYGAATFVFGVAAAWVGLTLA